MKRGIYVQENGIVAVIIPAPNAVKYAEVNGEQVLVPVPEEELISSATPEGVTSEVIEHTELPKSRNYRDAWTKGQGRKVDVDLEKAKPIQKALIAQKTLERAPKNVFGRADLSTVEAELEALDVDGAQDLTALYNKWPASIEKRVGARAYEV